MGMFILLITFLGKPVTTLGELVPHERFSQTSGIIPLVKILLIYIRLSRERERLTALAVFPSKLSLAFYGCSFLLWNFQYMGKIIQKFLL